MCTAPKGKKRCRIKNVSGPGLNKMNKNYVVREAAKDEWEEAMALAWKTFKKFVAPDYSDTGVKEFCNFISDNGIYKMFLMGEYKLWVAELDGDIAGMISVRSGKHISLLFVGEKYQRLGIGRDLINTAADYMRQKGENYATVNASPYGVPFYHAVGFTDTGAERMDSGMLITPMKLDIKK